MSASSAHHHRSPSQTSTGTPRSPPSSPPTQIHHSSILPHLPTPALVESVAGAAHYSGAKVDEEDAPPSSADALKHRRSSAHARHPSHVQVEADHKAVMAEIEQLRTKPDVELIRKRWRKDAVLVDSSFECKGIDQISAHWFALPKLSSHSEVKKTRVMSSMRTPNRLVFMQTQEYKPLLFGAQKTIDSVITVDFDDDERIVRFVDEPNGKPISSGFASKLMRRTTAKAATWLVKVPS